MSFTEKERKLYVSVVKRRKWQRYMLAAYIPIWIGWIFLVNYYGWPRMEFPLATVILLMLAASTYSPGGDTVALMEKLAKPHPELTGETRSEEKDRPI